MFKCKIHFLFCKRFIGLHTHPASSERLKASKLLGTVIEISDEVGHNTECSLKFGIHAIFIEGVVGCTILSIFKAKQVTSHATKSSDLDIKSSLLQISNQRERT